MVVQEQMLATRVNASMLPSQQGNLVCIVGTVQELFQSPKPGLKLRSSDGQLVTVFLLQNAASDGDLANKVILIIGRVMANLSIQASNLFVFPEQGVPFDDISHNKALEMANLMANDYTGSA